MAMKQRAFGDNEKRRDVEPLTMSPEKEWMEEGRWKMKMIMGKSDKSLTDEYPKELLPPHHFTSLITAYISSHIPGQVFWD